MSHSASITFHGGAGTVTGANFLLDTGEQKILVDCGLMQGAEFCEDANYAPFAYKPEEISFLVVTHAHTDHIGRIPLLVKRGFKGKIISTHPTKDIAALMYEDALGIMKEEAREKHRDPLYEKEDVAAALSLWETFEYYKQQDMGDDVTLKFLNAGHILGSAMAEFTRSGKKLVFTGDLGNQPAPVVKENDKLSDTSFLVMESVYGDRNHEEVENRHALLKEAIEDTRKKNGTLLIPAFSLQRTQSLLLEINALVEDGEIEPIDVYLDTPLGVKVLGVYQKYPEYFNERVSERVEEGDDPFDFTGLKLTVRSEESRAIEHSPNPKIIIAGSGMSHGGRIRMHEIQFLGEKSTTLLFVGYQSVGSLGRRLSEGQKRVRIDKQWVTVRAEVQSISGFSAHKDRDQLMEFVEPASLTLQKVFVAMGEPKSSLFLTQRLRDFFGVDATAPESGSVHTIDW